MVYSLESSVDVCLDFRKFIDKLREEGDLAEIRSAVDPHLEVGAITRRALELRDRAPLFENIIGSHHGLFRIFGAMGGLRPPGTDEFARVALHLGLNSKSTPEQIVKKSISVRESEGIPPRVISTGPCKQNKIFGKDVNLEKLPVPLLHRGDGGKYIQTYGLNCVQSPDQSWTSWSINRAMVAGKNSLTGRMAQSQHVSKIHNKWKALGKPTPWALVFGAPPAAAYVATMPLADGVSEVDYAGALAGQPLDVVKCETNDILVPANAEIILEGYITIDEMTDEGPFTEMHGYVFPESEKRRAEVLHVEAITYRDNAILPVCPSGRAPDETHTVLGPSFAAEMLRVFRDHDFPVLAVWLSIETCITWMVVQVDIARLGQQGIGHQEFSRKVGDLVFTSRPGRLVTTVLLVGPDIDVYRFEDVIWAYSTRCHPQRDVYNYDKVAGLTLVPFMSHGGAHPSIGGKVLLDCLLPSEYQGNPDWITGDFQNSYTDKVKSRVLDRWAAMGFRSQ